jgi:cytoskeletal protein RodZ
MSDIPADYRAQLDLRAVIAKIDRDRAETQKLQEEREKFIAESRKYDRDPWILTLAALLGVAAAFIARLPEILQALRNGAP